MPAHIPQLRDPEKAQYLALLSENFWNGRPTYGHVWLDPGGYAVGIAIFLGFLW